jgi:hypothetical protein
MHERIRSFKEQHNIEKIAGLMMLHYFKWPWCLEDLADYVDEIYLLLHYTPEFRADWPKDGVKVVRYEEIRVDHEWQVMEWRNHQADFREKLLRMIDVAKPDLVLFPDEDESYPEPEFLVRDLKRLMRSNREQLAFKRCNFWDSMEMVRKDKWIYYGPHVKIFKWMPGLTFKPYMGFNCVSSYGKRRMMARSAMKHFAYLEKDERERRYYELYRQKQQHFRGLIEEARLRRYTNARRAPRT